MPTIDFGFGGNNSVEEQKPSVETKTDLGGDNVQYDENGNPITDLNNPQNDKDNPDNKDNNNPDKKDNPDNKDNNEPNDEMVEGTVVEFDGAEYTVDKDGNLVDKEGKVFKEAKDVKDWLASLEVSNADDKKDIDVKSIQEALGITISGEDDKPVEYENSVEGVKKYVNDVIEASREEHYETALNTFFTKYPVMKDVLNYYVANGNSLDGFNQKEDRSNISIDKENKEQQKNIIRTAWKENNRRGNVEQYIDYLDSTNILYDTAVEELDALKQADIEERNRVAQQAKETQEQYEQEQFAYWTSVKDIIDSRKIAGYTIPENIVVTRDGKKISYSPKDFFNYVYMVDESGKSAYVRDLEKETPESRKEDEILRAYLKFVGGNYSNLVDMAINEEKVHRIKVSSKETKPKVTVRKPTTNNNNGNIDLGYN